VKSSEYFNASRLIDTEAELEKLIMNWSKLEGFWSKQKEAR
jgi:hypothetical protein